VKQIFKISFLSILLFIFFLSFNLLISHIIFADDLTDQINTITKQITDLENAINPLKKESGDVQSKISQYKIQIQKVESQMTDLTQRLVDKEADLEIQKLLLSERVKRYYKNTKKFNPLLLFFASGDSSSLLQQYAWYQSIIGQDKSNISQYSQEISTLNQNKINLQNEQAKIAKLKKDLEDRFGFLTNEIQKAETYKAQLSQKLQNLEAQRIAGLGLPTSAAGTMSCVDDRTRDPGFGTGFAFFTFGIPHHIGLNQYGAYGRANAGQNYHDILNAYYNNISFDHRSGITIKVNNSNEVNHGNIIWTGSLEDYVKRIYEVPSSWPSEALKAQAIAARSYVLATTNNGQDSICANQYCQVFKTDPKGGAWDQAVNDTSGEVMIKDGQVIKAYFASTAGGYTYFTTDVKWTGSNPGYIKRVRDTSGDINSFSDLFSKAYDKDSKCFYAAQGYRAEYNKSAWLKPSEVADIVNTVLLYQKDSSLQNHLCYKNDSSNGCTDTWGSDQVKTELKNRGGNPFNSISSASVSDWDKSIGRTTTLSFSGDNGSVSLDAQLFKSIFNIRAPANISIVGPLFNIEKRD